MKRRGILALLFTLCFIPFGVHAESKVVKTQEELVAALENTAVTEIVLGADIETTGKINITRDVTIDGTNEDGFYTIRYAGKFFETLDSEGVEDNTIWSKKSSDGTTGAVYVLQVYRCNVTLKNIGLTNGNRALGVNGGTVTLEGIVNVSGNGFHAIEVSSGKDVTETSTLKITDEALIINVTEELADETGNIDGTLYVDNSDSTKTSKIVKVKNGTEEVEEYENGTRISALDLNINLLYTIDEDDNKEVPTELLEYIKTANKILSLARVENDELVYTWEIDGKDITDSSIVLNTNITFTKEAPETIKTNISSLVANLENINYFNFEHDGKLPGLAKVSYYVADQYDIGTKLYVAHYNETTKKLETPQEVTVDEDGSITFEVTECSSYVVYTGTTTTTSANQVVENVKTGDINLGLIISAIVVAGIGLVITTKKIINAVK